MARRPPPPTSNAGPARPRAQQLSLSGFDDGDQPPAAAARPRTALGASRVALQVSDSSDDDSDGVIRTHGATFVAPPPARGSTPSVSRPAVRQLQLPPRDHEVQRMVLSDDGSDGGGGQVSGDDDAASLSDGSDVAEPSFPTHLPGKMQPRPPPPLPSMAPRAAESAVATLGVPAALNARASNTWIEAVEADALQPTNIGLKRETFSVLPAEEKREREDKKSVEERELRLALRRAPGDVSVVRKLAAFLFDQRSQHENAVQLLRNALGSSLACTDVALDLASMLQRHPSGLNPATSQEIRAFIQSALRENNSNSRAYSLQALLFEKEGNRSSARAQHELAVACGIKVPAVVYHNFGCFLEDDGEPSAAIEQYQSAIKADSYYTPSLINYAAAVIRTKGDVQHGGELLKRAILVAPNDADVVFNYGRFLEDHERQYILAADMFVKASSLQPLDENIVSHSAQFFIKVKQDNERALQLLRGLTKSSPQRARSFKLLAEFYHNVNKDVPSAIKIYQKAVTCAGSPREISDTWASFGACLSSKAHAYDKAVHAFRQALVLDRSNADALLSLADTLHRRMGSRSEALAMVVEEAGVFSSNYEFQFIAGSFHEDLGDFPTATKYYCACVKLNPKEARGIAAYAGMLHLHLHDDALAERYYREAMKLDLRSSNIIIEYANFLHSSGNSGKAEHYFAMACKVSPFDPNAQLALALHLKEMKKYDRARGAFEKAMSFGTFPPSVYREYALFLEEVAKDMTGAEKHYVLACKAAPEDASFLVSLAVFLGESRGRIKDAERVFEQALRMEPNNSSSLSQYALFLDTTARDVKSAEPVYLRAIEAAPTDADSLRNFAVFLSEKLKDFARADDYFARAVQARPDDNEIAWQYWRFLREKLKQPGRAVDFAARAHEHQAMVASLTSQPFALDRTRNLRASAKGKRQEARDDESSRNPPKSSCSIM